MKFINIFLKYFLFFNPTFLSPIINDFLVRTENIPYGLLYIKNKFSFYIILAMLFPIIFLLHSSIFYGFNNIQFKFSIIFISFLSGLWFFNNKKTLDEIQRAARFFFYFFIFLGIAQYFGLLNFINKDLFNIFFSRGNIGTGQSYRGVSFFFSEVSRASFHLIFIYLLSFGLTHTRENFLPFLLLLFSQIILISSTTGIILSLFLILFRYPRTTILISTLIIIVFLVFNTFIEVPKFNHYKIDVFIILLVNYEMAELIDRISFLSGRRYDGIIYSLQLFLSNPLGNLFNPYYFESVSGRMPVSGPILFLRTFGIFGAFYLFIFFKSQGKGNKTNALLVLLLACLYSPNGSWLTLAVVLKEYKSIAK